MKTFFKIFFVALIAVAPVSVFAAQIGSYPKYFSNYYYYSNPTSFYNGEVVYFTCDTGNTEIRQAIDWQQGLNFGTIEYTSTYYTWTILNADLLNGSGVKFTNGDFHSPTDSNFLDCGNNIVFYDSPPAPTTPATVANISLATSTAPGLVGILNGFLNDPGFYAVLLLVIGVPFAFWLMKFLLELFYENNRENERMAKKAAARAAIREEKKEKDFEDILSGNKGRREKEAAKFKYLSKMSDKDVDYASKQFNKKK
jgi:hypothetical protein